MGKDEKALAFSKEFTERSKAIETGLKKVAEKLIAEEKKNNGYLIIATPDGEIKRVPATTL